MDAAPGMGIASLAAAIAEPARARMLCLLMGGQACTATELAAAAEIGASTASAHLARLREQRLVQCVAQGKHRYFRLAGPQVGAAIEALLVVAGVSPAARASSTPNRLRRVRTCYDHAAGEVAVALHDRLLRPGWLQPAGAEYLLGAAGERALGDIGVDVAAAHKARRRFAGPCLDWSERRSHLGGALGAALLDALLERKWIARTMDSRALRITDTGKRALRRRFGI
jgi:DNA-binding transcriptional ArsR family regulator